MNVMIYATKWPSSVRMLVGAGVGRVVFTPEDAEGMHSQGQRCILVRDDTSPEDVGGMWASNGILTARGGMT
jgi:pyruvate,orthophosphate dikinase